MTGQMHIYPLDLRPVDEIVSFIYYPSYADADVYDQCWWCEGFYGGGSDYPILGWVNSDGDEGVMHPHCLPDLRACRAAEAERVDTVAALAVFEARVAEWQGYEDALSAAWEAHHEGGEPEPSNDLYHARDDAAVDIVRDLAGFLAAVRKVVAP